MKIAVVTWASSGLWKIFVDNLIQEKDLDQIRVLARSKDKLNELKTQYWDKIVPYTIDLSVHDEIIKFSKKLAETKCTIRYLVNNAWYGKFWASDEIPLEDSLNMIDLNIKAVVSMCYICTPFMHKWDHIINIASVASFQPIPYMNDYAATKAFVRSYSRALNQELKKSWISVTAVCPIWMKTNFMKVGDIWLKKAPTVYEPTVSPEKVVQKAISDAKKWKDISLYSGYSKWMRFLSCVLPDSWLMKYRLKMQNLD